MYSCKYVCIYINIANVKPFETSFSYLRGTMMAPLPALPWERRAKMRPRIGQMKETLQDWSYK